MLMMAKTVAGAMGTIAWLFLLNVGLRLIGEPSSASVVIGVALVAMLLASLVMCAGQLVKRYGGMFFVIVLVAWSASACTRVDPGHVGIQVNYYGTDRGVESYPRVTGMVWYNPVSTKVFEYPTYVQTAKWTKNVNEGAPLNEEITFTNKDGMSIAADISLSYHLVAEKVPAFYVKFRNDDLDTFTHGFLRNLARDKFDTHGGRYTIDAIMGDNAPFLRDVRADLQSDLTPLGVQLDQFGFIGSPRPPQAVIDSINAKVHATQLAIQKQNEIVQAQADANKEVAKTEGYARSVTIRADAEAAANRKISESLSANLIEYKRLEKWNGQLPQVTGQATPFITLK